MFCTKCGAKLEDDFICCPKCGQPVAQESQVVAQVQQPQKPVSKKDSVLSVLSCLFGFFAFILPFFDVTLFYMVCFAGFVLGVVDLCIYNKNTRHVGSIAGIVMSVLAYVSVLLKLM